ncbi:MAG: hypothetical protein JSV91_13420 [Phycisphaerales bacterium]|nr:MAG: hypothetical protein JSV91_13420 [Phycisphaerales bacterium]
MGDKPISRLRGIIRKLRPNTDQGPDLQVAAFGKHPAWDDHIPDLGLETDRLVQVKRILYLEGIGGNIDAGAWERLGPERSLPGFRHVFAHWEGPDWVLGRIWSSSDGKGRSRYPMIMCVGGERVEFARVAPAALQRLEKAREACGSTTSPAVVTSIVDRAREEVRAMLDEGAASGRPVQVEAGRPGPLGVLAARSEMGPDHEGLTRLLYHLKREMSEYLPMSGRSSSTTRAGALKGRGHHVRVPGCAEGPIETLLLWGEFLLGRFASQVPLWVICPLEGDWADLLIGPPTQRELFCIRVPPAELPLTTDVPYRMDAEFIERVEQEIALSRAEASGAGS